MEEIRQIGTDFGWVANIIGIILGLITIASIVFGIYKTIKNYTKSIAETIHQYLTI
ncbi:hypothetical protein TUM17384_36130 [Shewanella algae]|nr:hypothetical protein TUM17384_36130 [Shewanella algae]